jgi:tetratricopeptide (TPR) repeat protein
MDYPEAAQPAYGLKKSFYVVTIALIIVIGGFLVATAKLDEWNSKNELQTAEILNAKHKYGLALRHYRSALEYNANCVEALNNSAWLLATAPNPRLRDGKTAVTLASRACELTDYKQPFFIGTLAAACAEAGRFDDAIATARKAKAMALSQGQIQIAGRDQQLIELYQAGKPFHETADRN